MEAIRVAVSNPRAFVLGLALGSLLIASGFILALFATGQAGATHDSDGTVHACVSYYTGHARIMLPGRSPNCNTGEMLVELGAGDPAENLTYTVRTVSMDIPPNSSGQSHNVVSCLTGETAISGGSWVKNDLGSITYLSSINIDKGGGPMGSPPTGWRDAFSWSLTSSGYAVETWVICVS